MAVIAETIRSAAKDPLMIAGRAYTSRLLVGAGKRGGNIFVPGGTGRLQAGGIHVLLPQTPEPEINHTLLPAPPPRRRAPAPPPRAGGGAGRAAGARAASPGGGWPQQVLDPRRPEGYFAPARRCNSTRSAESRTKTEKARCNRA